MKESKKEKISNIQNLRSIVENDENDEISDDGDDLSTEPSLISFIDGDEEELEIDDEFIYNPSTESETPNIIEENNEIDEDFIIDSNSYDSDLEEDIDDEEIIEDEEIEEDYISEQFDNVVSAKVGKTPIIAIIGLIIGIIFIIISILTLINGSQRLIDNVSSGENGATTVIFLFIGLILILFSAYKILDLNNPFKKITNVIDSVDKTHNKKEKKNDTDIIEPEYTVPKSKTPINRESYKIGEFEIPSIIENINKAPSKLEGVSFHTTDASIKKKENKQITLDEVKESQNESVEETKEENNINNENENLNDNDSIDSKSIDDIFADVDKIEDISLIDSKKENE